MAAEIGDLVVINRALISVSDKCGLDALAHALVDHGVEILSTGGTARALANSGVPVKEVSDYTGFPEMMDGRVKTLHPKVHGGLLALRDNPDHNQSMVDHNIGVIDVLPHSSSSRLGLDQLPKQRPHLFARLTLLLSRW